MIIVVMALAGGLGAATRFVLDGLLRARIRTVGSVGTVVVNVSGAFCLGVVAGMVAVRVVPAELLLVGGTGFLGGYTTFSTASFETVRLIQQRRTRLALVMLMVQLTLSLVAAAGGYALGVWI